jgi:hypothetical protein
MPLLRAGRLRGVHAPFMRWAADSHFYALAAGERAIGWVRVILLLRRVVILLRQAVGEKVLHFGSKMVLITGGHGWYFESIKIILCRTYALVYPAEKLSHFCCIFGLPLSGTEWQGDVTGQWGLQAPFMRWVADSHFYALAAGERAIGWVRVTLLFRRVVILLRRAVGEKVLHFCSKMGLIWGSHSRYC